MQDTITKLLVVHFPQSLITSRLLWPTVALSSPPPLFFFNPFNLRYALRRDPTFIPTFSPASRNKIQNAFLGCQHASNYLICMQVKGEAVSVDFRLCIDPSTCQNEEDDGSASATKNQGVFKSKNLKKIFMFECVKRVQHQSCLL
jgi:hypothetical protein